MKLLTNMAMVAVLCMFANIANAEDEAPPAQNVANTPATVVNTNNNTTTNYTGNTTSNNTNTNTNTNTNVNTTASTAVNTNTNSNTNLNTTAYTGVSTNTNNNNSVVDSTSNNTNTNTTNYTGTNTNNNFNTNTSTNNNNNVNTNTNTNTSNNTNNNVNVSTSDSTSNNVNTNNNTSSSTSESNVNSNSTSNNTNKNENINKNETVQKIEQDIKSPPPSAIAPSIGSSYSQDLCTTGIGGAVQTQLFGFSAGKSVTDENCERIKLSKTLYDMGMKVAAVSLMCQDSRVWDAMRMAGTPCPFEGKIGNSALESWKQNPDRAPEGVEVSHKRSVKGKTVNYDVWAKEDFCDQYPEETVCL